MRIVSDVAVNTVELPPSADVLQSKRITRALFKSSQALASSVRNTGTINAQSREINELQNKMPQTQIKKAFIFESECVFDKLYDGVYSATVVTETGVNIPSELSITSNKITVKFEPLNEVATVSITVI